MQESKININESSKVGIKPSSSYIDQFKRINNRYFSQFITDSTHSVVSISEREELKIPKDSKHPDWFIENTQKDFFKYKDFKDHK